MWGSRYVQEIYLGAFSDIEVERGAHRKAI